MRRIYSENYHSGNRDFRIQAFKDNGKIIVKIYKVVDQKTEIIPQFQVTLTVAEGDDANIAKSKMFQRIIKASKLFLENFQ